MTNPRIVAKSCFEKIAVQEEITLKPLQIQDPILEPNCVIALEYKAVLFGFAKSRNSIKLHAHPLFRENIFRDRVIVQNKLTST